MYAQCVMQAAEPAAEGASGEAEEIQPATAQKERRKADGLDHRGGDLRSAQACLEAAHLLCTAADREGVPPEQAVQHLRSVALLCRSCLNGEGYYQLTTPGALGYSETARFIHCDPSRLCFKL